MNHSRTRVKDRSPRKQGGNTTKAITARKKERTRRENAQIVTPMIASFKKK